VNTIRILLVEDSSEDVLFFKRAAAKAGLRCSLEVVQNGQLAIDRLSAGPSPLPTHILLDLKMPLVSGLEVLAWIRSHPDVATLPVIILTSSQLSSDSSRANELGVDAFLVKPVSSKALLDIVREIAGRWNIPVGIA
jgi:two-component system response regulator